jgi:hypothetical protein
MLSSTFREKCVKQMGRSEIKDPTTQGNEKIEVKIIVEVFDSAQLSAAKHKVYI